MGRSNITMAAAGLIATSITLSWDAVQAATLPVPCVAGVCGASNPFVAFGTATAVQAGSKLTINQTSQNASLNWQSFNISSDGSVQFVQPNSSAVALNRIWDANPTQIFGNLSANGRVYLLNGNGIIFGNGAQVNVGSLIASSLNTTIDSTANNYSLLAPGLSGQGQAAFQQFTDPTTGAPLNHSVLVQQGANLQSAEQGQILIFAPQVVNEGTISTPGGQTVLAAGTKVYLASTDSTIRGLLVEVAADGVQTSVTNGNKAANANVTDPAKLVGQIIADRGNVTLAGLAVNQYGRVTATTSVNENGSIRLQAGTGTISSSFSGTNTSSGTPLPGSGGTLTVGANSVTQVVLDTADTATTVDTVAQPKSDITMLGATIDVMNNATVRATSGTIEALAAQNLAQLDGSSTSGLTATGDGSRVYIASDATLDVSGASVTLPVSSNVISAQLRGTELADSPLQQNGALRGQTVYFDIRQHGTNADGTTWQGTPLADVSGEISAIQRNVAERNLTGGTITLKSQGDVIVASGATLNVSGGQITYTGGMVDTTTLLTAAGKSVSIGSADPNVLYIGTLNGTTVSNSKWGTTTTYGGVTGQYEQGYVQGMDAGTLNLSAPKFVLDGNINGSTVAGVYQRLPSSAAQTDSNGTYFTSYDGQRSLYRNYDEVPLSATLNIGGGGSVADADAYAEYVVGGVVVQSGTVLTGLRNADGTVFNPLTDALPASYTQSVLRSGLLGSGTFSNVSILTDGEFLEPSATTVRLAAGGSFVVKGGVVDVEGTIDVPAGTISAAALYTSGSQSNDVPVSLTLGSQAALLARGEWVNDQSALYGSGTNTAPIYIDGGTVTLSARETVGSSSDLELATGSLIDVSAGARLTSTGSLVDGAGGSINIQALPQSQRSNPSTQPTVPSYLELGSTLRGYGLTEGGKLTVGADSVCIAAADCAAGSTDTLWLTPSFFTAGGFGAYGIIAEQGGLTVAPGTTLVLQQQSTRLVSNYASIGNAETLPLQAGTVLLPALERGPVDLTLTQTVAENVTLSLPGGNMPAVSITPDAPSLVIGTGASILADPQATLSLVSNSRIIVDGTLSAPGGDISLTLANTELAAYAPTQAIWLGSSGVLDVHGEPQIQLGTNGFRSGTVLGGGTVTLAATVGYVDLLPGSLINVSGSTGVVDVAPFAGPTRSQQVASAGGLVTLEGALGMILGGSFQASAGTLASTVAAQPAGGDLTIELLGGNSTVTDGEPSSFEIQLSQSLAPLVIQPGSAVPAAFAGTAYVAADSIMSGGFDSATLKADAYTPAVANPVRGPGVIAFNGSVSLSVGDSLTFDAGVYAVTQGATAQIHAPYVEFGNSDQIGFVDATTYNLPTNIGLGTATTGTLAVSGNFIELYGWTALQGIGMASFDSTGDLRLRGLQNLTAYQVEPLGGGLFSGGDIELSAGQIYPSTLSQFEIAAGVSTGQNPTVPTGGTITIDPAPVSNANSDLLSAGGGVTLLAGTVSQGGTVRAPFGTIDIEANTINLLAGSLTSTSANGLTIPFGTTQGGFDWVYNLANQLNIVYGTDGLPLPSQHVILSGANVNINKGAVIDVSGGGDLLAYEWIDGTGGTVDVLSQAVRPDQFAIVPSLKANVAPYDPSISPGTALQVGQTVYLSASPGLAAGYYTLLPARYALLPGAFLVSLTKGYTDLQPGQTYSAPGGGTIVSGYMTIAGTPYGDSRTSGFTVVPASVVLKQAQYNTTTANEFFTTQATSAGQTASRLPEDSGVLDLLATASLSLDGSLRTTPGKNGLGAAVDISSSDIVVASSASTPTQAGQLLLTTDSLNALGAQTLLIGGQLSSTGAITTTAQSVTIDGGATVSAPEVLLTATDQVDVSSGAAVTASGTAATKRDYTLTGDGALLSVAAGPQATISRTGADTNPTGVLTLAAGSTLTATGGSVYLDASYNVITQGTISAAGGDLALQSTHIAVGTPAGSASVSGTVLDPTLLSAGDLRNVLLASTTTIDFYGDVSLNATSLTLNAQGLSGYGAAGTSTTITASGTLTLADTQAAGNTTAGTGHSSLTLNAADINLDTGALSVTGFDSLALNARNSFSGTAQNSLTGKGSGSLTTDGSLAITASRITTDADVNTSLTAGGAVTLLSPTSVAGGLSAVTALGGSLSVSGSSIELGTQIVMPSGSVAFKTTGGNGSNGNIVVDSGGGISVAGLVRQYASANVATPGGSVAFQSAGNISLASGSSIDVSAANGGNGGSLSLSAGTGTISVAGSLLGGGAGATGSSVAIDAQNFDFAALNGVLGSGFTGARTYRLQGDSATCANDCNLVLASGSSIASHAISLEADNGSIQVDGTLNASGTAGGSVTLAAANDLIVNGTLDAHATTAGNKGGQVNLELAPQSPGSLQFNSGSVINVAGGGVDSSGNAGVGGSVLFRVPAATVLNEATSGGTGLVLAGTIRGASRTTLEAVKVYSNDTGGLIDSTGSISATDISNIYTDISGFMSNASLGTYSAQLTRAFGSGFALEAGVELDGVQTADDASGALELDSPWNLYTWRFGANGDIPGILTLRAAGGVIINSALSDGFTDTSQFTLPTTNTNSWSYRLVAGADLTAANPLTVSTNNTADVNITACTVSCTLGTGGGRGGGNTNYAPHMVRTGNGFIDVSASGSLILGTQELDANGNPDGNFVSGSQASLLYTAGVADSNGQAVPASYARGGLNSLAYPTGGGDINISVNGNVTEAPSTQFVNSWLFRVGSTSGVNPTAWTVNFQDFQQGIGALGGGDVIIRAGGDVTSVSVSIPTIGMPTGSTLATSTTTVIGGGNLTVDAGGSILGGSYYTGRGTLALNAGLDVGDSAVTAGATTYQVSPLLGLGDASAYVTARGDVAVSGVVNPSLLNVASLQSTSGAFTAYFSTYGSTSSVNLMAVGGDVNLADETTALQSVLGSSFPGGAVSASGGDLVGANEMLEILPPTLIATSLNGNVNVGRNLVLTPSATGNLQLFADQSVITSHSASIAIVVPDADPSLLPSVASPVTTNTGLNVYGDILNDATSGSTTPDQFATTPVHAGDSNPVLIVARTGDVDFSTDDPSNANVLWASKPVQITAGRDVIDLNLFAQNILASDLTSITAGRDIIYPQSRSLTTGSLLQNLDSITVAGPGELQLQAGRNVNFGTSGGITTLGNLDNTALATGGASVSIMAGVPAGSVEFAAFIAKYIEGTSTDFDTELVAFVESVTDTSNVSVASARQTFGKMSSGLQRTFVEQVFFDLLNKYGSVAAATGPKHNDYSGAYAALEALFPGSNPNLSAGETDPYTGDISLYFSRVYTEQGGNISLLAPGGGIDAGLAQVSSTFGVSKAPNQLGIVAETTGSINAFAYGNFQVNQSRVFAADGGNILVWSTEGDIDAGRGSKTSLSAAPATVTLDPKTGQGIVTLSAPLTGSGIQALASTPGVVQGDVGLYAPHGVVNADDAGIVANNLTIAATQVLGTNNITVTGTAVGVPVPVTGLGAAAVGASSSAAGAMSTGTTFADNREEQSRTPAADTALGWLDVFILGFGEEGCKADDAACLQRQGTH